MEGTLLPPEVPPVFVGCSVEDEDFEVESDFLEETDDSRDRSILGGIGL